MRLIFRRNRTALERLSAASWRCRSCDEEHVGLFHLSAAARLAWPHPPDHEPNHELRFDGDFLSDDFCVLGGEHYFVRGVFDIPVHGLDQKFGWGAWSTLSRANFDKYVEGFDDGAYPDFGPWPGYFSNAFDVFGDTLNAHCWVTPQRDRQRPRIALDDEDHPMQAAQREGISAERVLAIYEHCGHAPR